MYKEFYGFTGDPFRLSPDRGLCYRYPSFAKGRAYMQYALQAAEGFVVVTGSPGMGKTTLISDLLADYGPRDYLVATLVNTMLEANEVLRSAAYEFGLNVENMDTATVLQRLKQKFVQSHQDGRPPLLVVDEAQNLSLDALEELRMLTNLQAQGRPLLQIFLVGQEELREKLQDPRLEQLRQRVTAAAHLEALSQEQTAAYVLHRLKVVGWKNIPKIKASVLPVIDAACEGVPRRINQFFSRLLLHGAVEQKTVLDGNDARLVFSELAEERLSRVSVQTSAVLDAGYLGGGAAGAVDEVLFEAETATAEPPKKVVVPPPQRDAGPAFGEPLIPPAPRIPPMPSMPEPIDRVTAMPLVEAARPASVAAPAPRRPPQTGPGMSSAMSSGMRQDGYRAPRRPPRRGGFALAVLFLLLLGAGLYAWVELDRERAQELFGLEIDSYLADWARQASPDAEPAAPATSPAPVDPAASSQSETAGSPPLM